MASMLLGVRGVKRAEVLPRVEDALCPTCARHKLRFRTREAMHNGDGLQGKRG